jgi:hypothetical protein
MIFTPHQVHKPPELLGKDAAGNILARFPDGVRRLSADQFTEFHRLFEERIRLEQEDPYRYGYVIPIWSTADRQFAELREQFPKGVTELLILGGNRASKSRYLARRAVEVMVNTPGAKVWCLQSTESSSIQNQQPYIWEYLPAEWKPAASGKMRKGVVTNITYSQKGGFTENSFVLPNGSQCWFKFYSMDVKAIEGAELNYCWADELVSPEWIEALRFRLITRNGELAVGFTPILGYTDTVAEYLAGAVTLEDAPAELVLDLKGQPIRVPRVQQCSKPTARVCYFHTADNPFGNYEAMKTELVKSPKDRVLMRAYGVPTKKAANMFAKFNTSVHVVSPDKIPRTGVNYHVVDPCSGRNWFMIWARFDAAGRCFVYDEWPSQIREVPGVGLPGPWAIPGGNNPDGQAGDAQRSFGFGLSHYKLEIENTEARHARESDDFSVFERIMDSRYGNAATVAREGATTLIEECAEIGLNFTAAPGDNIAEGVTMIINWLSYNDDQEISALNQPALYISSDCKNMIFALSQYTGTGNTKTAGSKDAIDVLRYLVLSGAAYIDTKDLECKPAGSY